MAGYWPSSVFGIYGPRRSISEVHKHRKKERGPQHLAILTEQAWSIKDLLNGKGTPFPCGIQQILSR